MVQRIRRISFQITILFASLFFLGIALFSDQVEEFSTTHLTPLGEQTEKFFCGLHSLYSTSPITLNPLLTGGYKSTWSYSDPCLPKDSGTAAGAQQVCTSFSNMKPRVEKYFLLMMITLGISVVNVAIHVYQLWTEIEHWKHYLGEKDEPLEELLKRPPDFDEDINQCELEPERNCLCKGKLIYLYELLFCAGALFTGIWAPIYWIVSDNNAYCRNKDYTGRCQGAVILSQLSCGWSLGATNFHMMVSAFFQLCALMIKIKQFIFTTMVNYKSRLIQKSWVYPGHNNFDPLFDNTDPYDNDPSCVDMESEDLAHKLVKALTNHNMNNNNHNNHHSNSDHLDQDKKPGYRVGKAKSLPAPGGPRTPVRSWRDQSAYSKYARSQSTRSVTSTPSSRRDMKKMLKRGYMFDNAVFTKGDLETIGFQGVKRGEAAGIRFAKPAPPVWTSPSKAETPARSRSPSLDKVNSFTLFERQDTPSFELRYRREVELELIKTSELNEGDV